MNLAWSYLCDPSKVIIPSKRKWAVGRIVVRADSLSSYAVIDRQAVADELAIIDPEGIDRYRKYCRGDGGML